MNSHDASLRYRPARPAAGGPAVRPLQNDMLLQNDMGSPGAVSGAMPGGQGPAAQSPAAPTPVPAPVVVPPIPPLPLLPIPYDYNAEGLTMRDLLQECLGHYIIAEHQVGISNLITKEGRLVRVESNAYVLEEESSGNSLVCDYYSLKFFRCLGGSGSRS